MSSPRPMVAALALVGLSSLACGDPGREPSETGTPICVDKGCDYTDADTDTDTDTDTSATGGSGTSPGSGGSATATHGP